MKKELSNEGRLRNVTPFYIRIAVTMTWIPFKNFLAALSKTETNEKRPVK